MKLFILSLLCIPTIASAGDFSGASSGISGANSLESINLSSNASLEGVGRVLFPKITLQQQTEIFQYTINKDEKYLSPESIDILLDIQENQLPELSTLNIANLILISTLEQGL
jgi:hypothetical protein